MTDQIKFAAAALAQAERVLQDAQIAENGARAEVSDVEVRLADVKARQPKIRADLTAGTLTEAQAGGLYQIASADESDLADIHRVAVEQLGTACTATQRARVARDMAAGSLHQAEIREQFDALSGHAMRLEAALTGAIAELHILGRSLGLPQSLSAVWRPTVALRSAIMLGIPPIKVAP